MHDAMLAETITLRGHGDEEVPGYLARPLGGSPHGSVVVIHHMPGYDDATRAIARRFADMGYAALCPNLHHRDAPGAGSEEASAASREAGGVPDERMLGDVDGAIRHLRALPSSNGRVATIGFCSGGRQSFLAACTLPVDAAVDCYGGFVVRDAPTDLPISMRAVIDRTPDLRCPLLGLFGVEDQNPSPDDVGELERRLQESGKTYEFHSYAGAGHGFFAADRPSYRVEAVNEGWQRIGEFFNRQLRT